MNREREKRRCDYNSNIYCRRKPEELTTHVCTICQLSRIPERLDKIQKTLVDTNAKLGTILREKFAL